MVRDAIWNVFAIPRMASFDNVFFIASSYILKHRASPVGLKKCISNLLEIYQKLE